MYPISKYNNDPKAPANKLTNTGNMLLGFKAVAHESKRFVLKAIINIKTALIKGFLKKEIASPKIITAIYNPKLR